MFSYTWAHPIWDLFFGGLIGIFLPESWESLVVLP